MKPQRVKLEAARAAHVAAEAEIIRLREILGQIEDLIQANQGSAMPGLVSKAALQVILNGV